MARAGGLAATLPAYVSPPASSRCCPLVRAVRLRRRSWPHPLACSPWSDSYWARRWRSKIWMFAPLFGAGIRSALVILTLVAITGALHLDALADTADALGAGADRAHALDILRDSSVGVFGSIAIFSWLGLQWIALASLDGATRGVALYLVPGLGRWAMVAVAAGIDYLRPAGAGSFLKPEWSWPNLRTASVIGLIAIVPVFSSHARAATAAAIAVVLALRWFYRRWLGGVTGDLLGAAGALVEVAAMLAMAARIG